MDGSGRPQSGVNIGNILAGAGLLLSAGTTLIPEDSSLWPKVYVFLLGFTLFCLSVMRASRKHGPKLARWIAPGSSWASYQIVTDRPARLSRGWRLYDRALLIAIAYPILLPSLLWIFTGTGVTLGGSTELGGIPLLPQVEDILPRAGTIVGLAVAMIAPFVEKAAEASKYERLSKHAEYISYAGIAASVLITASFAGPLISLGTVIVVWSLSNFLTGSGQEGHEFFGAPYMMAMVTGAASLTVVNSYVPMFREMIDNPLVIRAIVIVVPGVLIYGTMVVIGNVFERLSDNGTQTEYVAYILLTAACIALFYLGTVVSVWETLSPTHRTIFVFLGLLPLTNALCDYVSYVVTLTLLRIGHHRPTAAIVTGVLDLCLAFLLFLGSGAAIVAVVAWVNDRTGVEVIPLARLFHSVVLDSQKALSEMEYLWVYAMLFSTIVPTLLHAALALFSLESLMPERLRDWFHRILASDDEFETLAGLLSLSLLTTTCLFLPVYLVYRLLAAIVTVAPEFLHYYLDWLTSIACHIGPQHCPA